MPTPRTKGIMKRYDSLPDDIKAYFEHFPELAENFPWDVSISYLFSLVELAHNMTIYCGVVKLHQVDTVLARASVDNHHMTREGFKDLYKIIFGKPLKKSVINEFSEAEKARDCILHGKSITEEEKRKAVIGILNYAEALNSILYETAGLKPFGSIKGFKGRKTPLDKSTSRWVLKGVGLPIS